MGDLTQLRSDALRFLHSMRDGESFAFRFSPASAPSLIGTALAAMLAGVTGWIQELSEEERKAWAGVIKACQRLDGWFEDDDIADCNLRPGYGKDRALLHRTRHALMALAALGERPEYPLAMTDAWRGSGKVAAWCAGLNLADYWYSSNMLMDAALLLLESGEGAAVDELLDFCDAHLDPRTGYHDAGLSETRNAMAGAMHLYPVYIVRNRPILHAEAAIRTTLALQQPDGLYGYESGSGGEDCLDYDAVSILCNLGLQHPALRAEIITSMEKTQAGLAICRNADGGFCAHRREETYYFGTHTTPVRPGDSSLWATYSRLLTLLMIEAFLTQREPPGWRTAHNFFELWNGGVLPMSVSEWVDGEG
ncbi:MAG: prenyltransferase/squalene oxidase repeat-containing protein [Armatimonadota bacterium]